MGRGLVATRDIKVGDILVVEEPFVCATNEDNYYHHCYHCTAFCLALVPCFRCSLAMFCSEECRKEAWEKYHHVDCFAISIVGDNDRLLKIELLALKAIVIASSRHKSLSDFRTWLESVKKQTAEMNFNEGGQYISTDYRTIYDFQPMIEKKDGLTLYARAAMAACVVEFLDQKTKYFAYVNPVEKQEIKMFVGGLIFRHISSLSLHGISINEYVKAVDDTYRSHLVGTGVCAVVGLLNHSCCPSVERRTCEGKVMIVAIRSMRKGDQVFMSFSHWFYSVERAARRAYFAHHNHFECACQACEENWPLYDELSDLPIFRCVHCRNVLSHTRASHGSVDCPKCHKKTDVVKFYLDVSCAYSISDEHQPWEMRMCEYAKCLDSWDKLVVSPWKLYFETQIKFLGALMHLSTARCDDKDLWMPKMPREEKDLLACHAGDIFMP